jgi:hypothetical protein
LAYDTHTFGILDTIANTIVGAAEKGVASTALSSKLGNRCCKGGEGLESSQEEERLGNRRHLESSH